MASPDDCANRTPRTLVGAIRWDAWVGDQPTFNSAGPTNVGREAERTLGPTHWRDRLPFYARELNEREVEVRAISQEVIDQEITFASDAGIDYWAFAYYAAGTGLDTARRFYLASVERSKIAFCFLFDGVVRFRSEMRELSSLLDSFARPEHVRVLGGRPLVFFLARAATAPTADDMNEMRREVDAARDAAVAAGVGNPYVVCMGGGPTFVKQVVDKLGLDAGSAYAVPGKGGMPFAQLAGAAEQRWDEYREAGLRVLPWVTTGWDPRPLVENPVSWSKWDPDGWAQPGTPAEIAAHLDRALAWTARYPAAADANAVTAYAWNEFAGGGLALPYAARRHRAAGRHPWRSGETGKREEGREQTHGRDRRTWPDRDPERDSAVRQVQYCCGGSADVRWRLDEPGCG
jgi:hypothetical protein